MCKTKQVMQTQDGDYQQLYSIDPLVIFAEGVSNKKKTSKYSNCKLFSIDSN